MFCPPPWYPSTCNPQSPTSPTKPMEPLQRQPKQSFKSPTGERLILAINDYGYPKTADSNSNSLARGRWLKIANTDETTFFQEDYYPSHLYGGWTFPAVVLAPEEYTLRVGGMSVVELRTKLEEYWGRCGMKMWISRWEEPRALFVSQTQESGYIALTFTIQ